jgi:hypothetical protein
LGLSPSVVVTNAVAVDQDLMFLSNGEGGVYLQSVNRVAYQNKYLIVAAGLGGLKIVQVL